MRYSFAIFFFGLFFLNIQLGHAQNGEGIDVSKCQAPTKEEEEFEPYLCTLDLPAIRKIQILRRIENKKDPNYNQEYCIEFFKTTPKNIQKFIRLSSRISENDLHYKMVETSPCGLFGQVYFIDGSSADWYIQSDIRLGRIIPHNHGPTQYFYCPKDCSFVPTFKVQDNK